jgi:hypothetical protein
MKTSDRVTRTPSKSAAHTARPGEASLKVQGDKILGPGRGVPAKQGTKPAQPKGKRA